MAAARHQRNYHYEDEVIDEMIYVSIYEPEAYELVMVLESLKLSRRQKRRLEEVIRAALLREKRRGFEEGYEEGFEEGMESMEIDAPEDWGLGYGN